MATPEHRGRKTFEFSAGVRGGPPMSPEEKGANALEYIAHYLDRIESHLEGLAASARDANGARVSRKISAIAHVAPKLAAKG